MQLGEEARARYEILRVVNRGGMGEIALGRVRGTKGFEKLVVLKRLRADAERDDHLAMFDVEQELMSRIEHPNIVKVFDQPIIDNTPYLAMEYVRGRNLDQVIRQAKDAGESLSVAFSLTVISEVLRGLAFVHRLKDNEGKALGVVHQDITPSNIMVSFFGEVKITDFGISYVTSRDGGLRRGVLKGKPRYVAPEVLAGKRVNNRADIYGVGVVLFELMTQAALFARGSVKETLSAVARGEVPDFRTVIPNISDGVMRIFERSLAKDPADRYRTSEEMGADVVGELAKLGGPMSPARLGHVVRQYFRDDPDVPEVDPSFEAALSAESAPVLPASFRAPDLSQTLSELDRLLPKSSTDLFTLPPELKSELSSIEDMDPFLAATPAPDFVWDASNEAEILRRASAELGNLASIQSVIREPPSLGLPEESGGLRPFELPPFEAPPRRSSSLTAPPAPTAVPAAVPGAVEARRSTSSSSESSPPPAIYTDPPGARNGKARPVSTSRLAPMLPPQPPFPPIPSLAPSPAVPAVEPVPVAPAPPIVEEPRAAPPVVPVAPVVPVVPVVPVTARATPGAGVPQIVRSTPAAGVPQIATVSATARAMTPVRGVASVEPSPAAVDAKRNFQFWLGLVIGLALGLAGGAVLFSMFMR